MVLMTIALGVVVLIALFLISIKSKVLSNPGPPHYPFLGCTIWFMRNFERMPEATLEITKAFGYTGKSWSMSILHVGPTKGGIFVVSCPKVLEYITKENFTNYELADVRSHLLDFMGKNIFTTDGDRWKFHRKVAVQMFSKSLLREATFVAASKSEQLIDICKEHASQKKEFDLQQKFFGLTMDVFCQLSFGVDVNALNTVHPFSRAFDRTQHLAFLRYAKPGFWELEKLFGMKDEAELKQGRAVMVEFAQTIINERRNDVDANLGPDLVSRFIHRAKTEGIAEMDDEEMINTVISFLLAGRDTTASALSWIVFELIKAPEHVETILAELKLLMDEKYEAAAFDELSYEDQFDAVETELPFLKAVIMEGLRLHPSVITQGKIALNDDVLPDGTKIKKGQTLYWSAMSMCRDDSLWTDASSFSPKRWLNENAEQSNGDGVRARNQKTSLHRPVAVSDFKYPVFNCGPRLCIGRSFAVMEMKIVLAILLPKFKFKLARETDDSYLASLTAPMKHGLHVTCEARK